MRRTQSPKERSTLIRAFSEMAPRYEQIVDSELRLFWGWRYDDFVSRLVQRTPVPAGGLVLDVATGTGMIPLRLVSQDGSSAKVHGLDITYAMLHEAGKRFQRAAISPVPGWICASAMDMPIRGAVYDVVLCGLAIHHLDLDGFLAECYRVLKPGGVLSIADVGGSPIWSLPPVAWSLRIVAFFFFLFKEDLQRARAEATAVPHILTAEKWQSALHKRGFTQIYIEKIPARYKWIPEPLAVQAIKPQEEY